MEKECIETYNRLLGQIHAGGILTESERIWLWNHPIESSRYDDPWILSDLIPLEPGIPHTVVIQCLTASPLHSIVPTFTIPFEQHGFVKLSGVVGAKMHTAGMKESKKLSFRMLPGITATASCVTESGLLMISYQGWVPDAKPIPLWYETAACDRFAMKKKVISENAVQYVCRGADGTEDAFSFCVNWYAD